MSDYLPLQKPLTLAALSFAAGIAITLSFQRLATKLAPSSKGGQESKHNDPRRESFIPISLQNLLASSGPSSDALDGGLTLPSFLHPDREDIKNGLEGCIGNTPLIRIRSLSEYLGCEVLAKAEVGLVSYFMH